MIIDSICIFYLFLYFIFTFLNEVYESITGVVIPPRVRDYSRTTVRTCKLPEYVKEMENFQKVEKKLVRCFIYYLY